MKTETSTNHINPPDAKPLLAADFLAGKEFRFHKGEFRRYRLKGKPGDGWLESANNNGADEYMYCFVSAVTNDGFYYRGFESEIAGQRTPHILPNDKFQPFSSLQVCR